MEVTLKELKIQPGRVLAMAENGTDITITVRGVPKAKLVSLAEPIDKGVSDLCGFGMWSKRDDMQDIDGYIRELRRGRKL